MKIFFLDKDPRMCALAHCDKHVEKMILEYAKMMSTAHHMLDPPSELHETMYKCTHENHPTSKWIIESNTNYSWLYDVWFWLAKEHWWRYELVHKSWKKLYNKLSHTPNNISLGEFTTPPITIPNKYKIDTGNPIDDIIQSYRKYYIEAKLSFANMREAPEWYINL